MSQILPIGPIPPVITPFDKHEDVDYEAFAFNLERWIGKGIKGFVLFGSNSEAIFLSEEEKLRLLSLAVEICGDRAKVIAGTGLESTRATMDLTAKAANAGAAAALVLTPSYYLPQMDDEALRDHFTRLADASDIPLLIYNVPKYTGLTVSHQLVKNLSAHNQIIGMKDSTGDLARMLAYQEAADKDFQVLPGTASIWYPALIMGAEAGIMALANCAPEICMEVYRLFQDDQWEEAEYLYRKLLPLNTAVTAGFGIAGLKYACSLRGYKAGVVRRPLRKLSRGDEQKLEKLFEAAEAG